MRRIFVNRFEVHIRVRVLWPDGKPVAEANVWLSQVSEPTAGGTDGSQPHCNRRNLRPIKLAYRVGQELGYGQNYLPLDV